MEQEHSLSRNCQISLLLLGHLTIYIGNPAQMMENLYKAVKQGE